LNPKLAEDTKAQQLVQMRWASVDYAMHVQVDCEVRRRLQSCAHADV